MTNGPDGMPLVDVVALREPGAQLRVRGSVPSISFTELVQEMMNADLRAAQRDVVVTKHGFEARSYHE